MKDSSPKRRQKKKGKEPWKTDYYIVKEPLGEQKVGKIKSLITEKECKEH